jgi:hypothetical protein
MAMPYLIGWSTWVQSKGDTIHGAVRAQLQRSLQLLALGCAEEDLLMSLLEVLYDVERCTDDDAFSFGSLCSLH